MKLPFEPIAWSDQMVTGVEKIDEQHRYLVATLRQANSKVLDDPGGTHLADVARDLLTYAIMHFETEEELMQRHGYAAASPDLARQHIAQHRDFSGRIVAVIESLREGRQVSRIDVLKYLNDWLRDHVLGIDQQLGRFVAAAAARADGERPG